MAEMSIDNIRITADSCEVDFQQARRLAELVIRGMVRAPRLVAWMDNKKKNKRSLKQNNTDTRLLSNVDAQVRVDINDNDYSFIFTETK